jgi:hypothetical protein
MLILFESSAIRSLSLQMSLAQRFNDVTCDITRISALEIDQQYPIERADKVTTRYGETILLGIRDTTVDKLYKLFLPQRKRRGVQGR